jgi:hypothetical protein
MIKNFKTLGAFSKGRKPEGGLRGKGATPIPEEVEVMPIFNWPHPDPEYATRLAKYRVLNSLQWGTQAKACQVRWDLQPTKILNMLRITTTGPGVEIRQKPKVLKVFKYKR